MCNLICENVTSDYALPLFKVIIGHMTEVDRKKGRTIPPVTAKDLQDAVVDITKVTMGIEKYTKSGTQKFGEAFGCVIDKNGYLVPHSGPFAVISCPYLFGRKSGGKLQSDTMASLAKWGERKTKMAYDPNKESFMHLFVDLSPSKWAKEAGDWAWIAPWLAAFFRCQLTLGRIVIFLKMPSPQNADQTKFVLGEGQMVELTAINYSLKRSWIGGNTDGKIQGDTYRVMSLLTYEDDPHFVVDPSRVKTWRQERNLWQHDFWKNPLRSEEAWMRNYLGQNPRMRGKSTSPECYTLWAGSIKESDQLISRYV